MSKLNERAMLVGIKFSQWTGRTKDKKVSQEVMRSKHADGDSGSWWTYLAPKKALQKINTAYCRCDVIHRKLTLPWTDGGLRILPSAMFMEYRREMSDAIEGFHESVEEFLRDYPTIRQEAKDRLGDLLDGKILPTAADIRSKFGVVQTVVPLPTVQDFRVDLSADDLKEVREQITRTLTEATGRAMGSIWEKLAEMVDKVEVQLSHADKTVRKTVIQNLAEFCKRIPKMNIADDAKLESIRKEVLDKLGKLDAATLRESAPDRKKAAKTAKQLSKKIGSFKL